MPDSTAIAIVSVSVAGISTVVAPIASGLLESKREQRRFEEERLVKDFDELRALLDEIGEAIWKYIDAVGSLQAKHSTAKTTEPSQFKAHLGTWDAARDECYRLNRRLVIRLGREHDVTAAYGRALKPLDEAGSEVARMIAMEQEATTEKFDERVLGRPVFYAAYEDYLDAAERLVGSPVKPLKRT